jgi:dolichol-phosphate mannosyltransferase
MLLSVIMPLYNEERTAAEIINRVLALPIELELIIVNNGSTDDTRNIIHLFASRPNVRIIDKNANIGKGDAVIDGLRLARGKYTVIQDGDLEYDPEDFVRMIQIAEQNRAVAVFGSRIRNPESGISYQRYLWGGKMLTILANLLFDVGITDESTCYKMVRTDTMKALNLQCRRFEFCPEIVAKLGRNKIKIYEIPVTYRPRKFEEGKKIRWMDGLEAVWTLIKYRFQPLSRFAVKEHEK